MLARIVLSERIDPDRPVNPYCHGDDEETRTDNEKRGLLL